MLVISGSFSITIRAANRNPVWASNPAPIEFKSGAPSKFDVRRFVSDADGDTLDIEVIGAMEDGTIPGFPGVKFDGTDLVFDGREVVGPNLVGELKFSADDGRATP